MYDNGRCLECKELKWRKALRNGGQVSYKLIIYSEQFFHYCQRVAKYIKLKKYKNQKWRNMQTLIYPELIRQQNGTKNRSHTLLP